MRISGTGSVYLPRYRSRTGERRTSGVYWWKLGRARVSTGMRTEKAAQGWVMERLVEMRRGHLVGLKAAAVQYDDLERMLLERWAAEGRVGVQQAAARLRFLRKSFAGWRAEAITTDRITAYSLRRRAAGAAPATVNLELALLHRAFAIARECGRLDVIPVVRRLPGVGHRTGTVERGDLDRIVEALPERYRAPVWLLYWSGWREGEVLGLTWQRVDLRAGEIRLGAADSKTRRPRTLAFGPESQISRILAGQWQGRRAISPFVFPGRSCSGMNETSLQKAWRAACGAAGIPGHPLIHDLRRTAARDLRRAGVPLAEAMGQLGHRDIRVHQDYSTVARADQAEALAKLEALRAGEPVQQRFARIGG